MARSDEGRRFTLDEPAICLTVPGEDCLDDDAIIGRGSRLVGGQWFGDDGPTPGVDRAFEAGDAGSAHGHDAVAWADPS